MRAIDADKLNAFIGDERATLHNEQRTFKAMSENEFNTRDYMLSNFQYIIDNAPTVDFTFEETSQKTICENRLYCPARPAGEWINIKNRRGWLHLTCSCCSYNDLKCTFSDIPKFCPNCGAKMKGGADE